MSDSYQKRISYGRGAKGPCPGGQPRITPRLLLYENKSPQSGIKADGGALKSVIGGLFYQASQSGSVYTIDFFVEARLTTTN